MLLEEFISELIIYLSQKSFFREQQTSKFMDIELIQASTVYYILIVIIKYVS